jgi:hypothetical protein
MIEVARLARKQVRGALRTGLAVVALSSCTIVEITDPEGATSVERRFGLTSIAIEPERDAVVASLRSFGVASTPLGFTAGYAAHELAVLGQDCRVVFWVESDEQRLAVEELAATLQEVCIVSPH